MTKSQDKNLNILRTKKALQMKEKAFSNKEVILSKQLNTNMTFALITFYPFLARQMFLRKLEFLSFTT